MPTYDEVMKHVKVLAFVQRKKEYRIPYSGPVELTLAIRQALELEMEQGRVMLDGRGGHQALLGEVPLPMHEVAPTGAAARKTRGGLV